MDHMHAEPHASGHTSEKAQDDSHKAIRTVLGMLSKEVATETASFMVDASLQLYPRAMRDDPLTPAATSLREYHFTTLMRQVLASYGEGRGQDFADDRFAIHDLLQEEPEHQTLAERFCRLMGLWLQEAHNKRQQEKMEREQRHIRQWVENKMREAHQELEAKRAEKKRITGGNERLHGKARPGVSKNGSSLPIADKQNSVVGDRAPASPPRIRAKDVFDLAGLNDTNEDE